MTNAEILALQRQQRELRESAATIVPRLRAVADGTRSVFSLALLAEAAHVVEYLQAQISRMRQEAHDEQRESQRSAASAYTDGRHDGLDEARRGF